ncbi:hypothetical protein ACM39_12710 [Chryseobacterium sp. FH2]|uniref:hypothetical protein n=1 Tax=Chryseobacterium sp. FH2 TaxID=1674291 RepID=UPI00065AF1DD|nr:hypothetical protein [Chryseobacterium sp. FH2]KMQ67707.1 hypothetical protein ACM39_12710 [Chryseobacterium sp. FH2]
MDLNQYFQSYENYFWEWTTDEDVPDASGYNENNLISIPKVGAIAYRAYVIEVLKALKIGFPSFSSLLLTLYATQDGCIDFNEILAPVKNFYGSGEDVRKVIDETTEFLEKIKVLPKAYKQGQNRIILLHSLFLNTSGIRISSGNSELILGRYRKRPHKISECAVKKYATPSFVVNDLGIFIYLNRRFPTAESVIDILKDEIEDLNLEEEIVEDDATVESGNRDFIQELIEEPKTFQVGSLIKRIWSGLKIPMKHLSPGEQPIGGISDMTNKGELHRMLLSEFANEDEIFISRIANNEALFIQREIPPEENIFERIILIDTSLKNWGTPKVLAFASTIAIIKHPKAHSECKVFALGKRIIPISLDNIEDVVENLNQVSGILDVSPVLEEFFQKERTEKDLEVFFITNEENLDNENLQKVIHENRNRLKFVVTTSSDGELNFYKHHKGTKKHIQKILLPLQELWANPPKRKIKNNVSVNGSKTPVPLNYPLLFPTPKQRIATFLYEGEFYILTNKKQLLKTYLSDNYYNKNIYLNSSIHRGSEVLVENISVKPKGQFALAKDKAGRYVLCQYQPDKKLLSKLNLNTKEYSELNVTGQNIPLNFRLIYFNRSFYLYQDGFPTIFKINIEGHISIEQMEMNEDIDRRDVRNITELARLSNGGTNILSNFGKIGINEAQELVVSKLALIRQFDNVYNFHKNYIDIEVLASQDKNKFTFEDGSEIITDPRGMLTFMSSNKHIPTFYMPSTHYGYLALATEKDFGGSEYYLPKNSRLKVKEMDEMYSDYMKVFIKHILDYGTKN